MDWITGIQNAINYIEEHLTEEIDYEIVLKKRLVPVSIFKGYSVFCVE